MTMGYAIFFSSTDTQLTMLPYAATRCGHDTTTLSHAADGPCDPWRWLYSPGRLRLRPSTLLTHQQRPDPPRLLPSTCPDDTGWQRPLQPAALSRLKLAAAAQRLRAAHGAAI